MPSSIAGDRVRGAAPRSDASICRCDVESLSVEVVARELSAMQRTKPDHLFVLLLVVVAGSFATFAVRSVRAQGPDPAAGGGPVIPLDRLEWHLPNPEAGRSAAAEELERAVEAKNRTNIEIQQSIIDRISSIRRPTQVRLSLDDVVRRTLANNYLIETLSYNPAVETTRVVEAQAAFDALFFTSVTKNKVNRPTGNQLFSTDLDSFSLSTGLSKRLAGGASARGTYTLSRTKQSFAFQVINPEYFSSLALEIRQPLLRNFGIDFNRSLIMIAKNDRRISDLLFRRQIRDTLRTVIELYWRLVQARRNVVITAREVADFEAIYQVVVARKGFDTLPVSIFTTEAALEAAKAGFVSEAAAVFDAEDRLIAAMNDPQLNLADSIELIPTEFPTLQRIMVDRLAEVQSALDHRTELKEQELQIAKARIGVGQARNSEQPRFDLTFRTTYDGLAGNADGSFDEMSRSKFIEYYIGVEFEVPVGNRGPRAARRRAELVHAQARANLKRVFEDVILDVNLAVRRLSTTYDLIPPSFASVEARQSEVNSQRARAERKDYPTLTTELSAWRALAGTRRAILNEIVEYNIAIVDLERAKGTLLEYNNVVIPTEVD